MMARKITGIKNFTKHQQTLSDNGQSMRKSIRDYIHKRKSGEVQSKVAEGVDLLSLFLMNPEVFDDELIIDEILDFLGAGVFSS